MDEDATEAAPPAARPLPGGMSQALGQIVGLMMASPPHKQMFLGELEWLVVPPLRLRQFRLFHRDNAPIGYASWAFVTPAVEERLAAGQPKLMPAEWTGGGQAWLMDLIAPFGGGDRMMQEIKASVFPDRPLKTVLLAPGDGQVNVVEV